jgi:antitoxin ParD1/3/4
MPSRNRKGKAMATLNLSLDEHWNLFIQNAVASGRYGSAAEVVRDALRVLEERESKLATLRAHVQEGLDQADRGEFADPSKARLIAELDRDW